MKGLSPEYGHLSYLSQSPCADGQALRPLLKLAARNFSDVVEHQSDISIGLAESVDLTNGRELRWIE